MKDEAAELGDKLKVALGDHIETSFIDVSTTEIKNYPEIEKVLTNVRLPLTVINGQPRFHGGLGVDMIVDAIKELDTK